MENIPRHQIEAQRMTPRDLRRFTRTHMPRVTDFPIETQRHIDNHCEECGATMHSLWKKYYGKCIWGRALRITPIPGGARLELSLSFFKGCETCLPKKIEICMTVLRHIRKSLQDAGYQPTTSLLFFPNHENH